MRHKAEAHIKGENLTEGQVKSWKVRHDDFYSAKKVLQREKNEYAPRGNLSSGASVHRRRGRSLSAR